jgi:hypothetical protein
LSDILATIYAWVPVNKDTSIASGFGGTADLNNLVTVIRARIRTNDKSYVTFPFIVPNTTGPIIKGEDNKIMQMSQDFRLRFITEVN